MIHGVILAGGKGERFWPLSRTNRPKQLLRLISQKTMLQETIDRILPMIPLERIMIVTSVDMVDPILAEIPMLNKDNILAEPFGRDTCLAIGLAARHIRKTDPDGVMIVLSADHIIRPAEKLLDIISAGAQVAAADNKIITIGIYPTRPETGYGYIKVSKLYKEIDGLTIYEVESFTEKPRQVVAQEYYYGRRHLWNSGMFIWSVNTIIEAISSCQKDTGSALDEYESSIGSQGELDSRLKLYNSCKPISIDFAVLENAANVVAIKAELIWDDVGSWNALERYKDKDNENNVVIGSVKLSDTYESTLFNNGNGIVVAIGISDLVVVKSEDIVLVAHKTKVNEVKKVLAELSSQADFKSYL